MSDEFIDIRQAARRGGVSTSTVKRWLDEGRLTRYYTATRRVRVLESEVRRVCTPQKADSYSTD